MRYRDSVTNLRIYVCGLLWKLPRLSEFVVLIVPSIFSLETRQIGVCMFGLAWDVHALLGHSVQDPGIAWLSLHSWVVLVSLDLSAPLQRILLTHLLRDICF